jgi:ATP-binding cassette subfamily B protein
MAEKITSQEKKGSVFGKLLQYIKPLWGILMAVVLMAFLGSVLSVITPNFTKNIVNEIQNGITGEFNQKAVSKYVFLTVIALLASFLCNFIQTFLAPLLSQKTAHKMREEVNIKANRIPLQYFDTTSEGDTLSTMTNDIDILSTSFSSTLPTLVTALATVIGCLALMFFTNCILAVTTIIGSVVGLLLTMKVLGMGAPYFKKNQNLLGRLNALVNEDIKGHIVVKSFNAETEVVREFDKTNKELFESTWKTQMVSYMMTPMSSFANNFSYILVCIVGAMLVITQKTMIGTIVAFIQYVQIFAGAVSQVSQAAGKIQPAFAAGDRIFALLEQPEMKENETAKLSAEQVRGEVDFSHVKFGYDPEAIIVHDFSCHVEPGQKIAIVGPTGAGKSTLINLLTRFYEVNGGDIQIDGTSIYDLSRETLHSLISMVLQETWTFQGSIRENIVYSKKNVTDEQLETAIKNCGLDDFIRMCPDGVDTILAEDADISAGQKQLITIARAMVDDAPILILDEATSSVDTRTEKIISAAIDKLMEGRTSFVIAHRLSTIRNADKILVLKDGDIIEMGTHDELMNKKGFYAELYMSQFDNQQQERV